MVKDELGSAAGFIALLAILFILVVLLAVLALVVVNALAESSWGIFTVGATIPIALFMGGYLRSWRPGKVLEASIIGIILLLLAVWGGQQIYRHADLAAHFTFKSEPLAWTIIVYGFAASVLPIWLLLAPRDYLSTFMKLGVIVMLALGIFLVLPAIQMPALTPFGATGNGPVFAGKLFPFCFITIACGAVSGFHSLIASGTTPKILSRESGARSVGYGAMCLESLVAIMALIAACTLDPGVYFSVNMKGDHAQTVAAVTALHYPVTVEQMDNIAASIGEKTLFGRVGGAPTLAVGMAKVFSNVFNGAGMDLWYHFAIMFEALFILTTLDAGTRWWTGISVAGLAGARLEAARSNVPDKFLVAGELPGGWRMGMVPDSRRARPAWRNQFSLAALRNRQPASGRHRALSCHDSDSENAIAEQRTANLRPGHAGSTFMAADRDQHGKRREDFPSQPENRLSRGG